MEQSWSRQQLNEAISRGRQTRSFTGPIKPGSEDEIQANYFAWVDLHLKKYPLLSLIFAIPNGSDKSKTQRFVMKLTGLRSGVPDVFVSVPKDGFSGMYIEFKRPGQYATEVQRDWHQRLTDAGYYITVQKSWITAANMTIEYLGLDIEKLNE